MSLFEPKPRFVGAPLTCSKTGLLAFDDRGQVDKFLDATLGAALEVWKCPTCSMLHMWPARHHKKDGQQDLVPPHIAKLIIKAL